MSNSALAGQAIIEFPAGMIMPYAGAAIPSGWLECNGAEVDISAYPRLAAALGSTWNTAKNPLTGATYAAPAAGKFRVPDMRGAFLRGSSGGSNNAQGVATGLAEFQAHKTAKNGLSNSTPAFTGSGVTSGGMSANADHTHNGNQSSPSGAGSGSYGGIYWFKDGTTNQQITDSRNLAHTHSVTASGSVSAPVISGDAETRPDSVGVRYLIKA
jgi:microcystin-dependent protein